MTLKRYAEADLPTAYGPFRLYVYRRVNPASAGSPAGSPGNDAGSDTAPVEEHMAIVRGDISRGSSVLCRVHSECWTSEVIGSLKCDCREQLDSALEKIAAEGAGVVVYLRQEGRGIGLGNKIRAYDLQNQGADTVEANLQLGFHADARNYELVLPMLQQFGIESVRLMTNNPRKIDALGKLGIQVAERVPLLVNRNAYNDNYLNTKQAKLGHMMNPVTEAALDSEA